MHQHFPRAFCGIFELAGVGTAEILSLPDAMEPLVDFYKRVLGEHPDWQDYRQAKEREKRVLIHITIDRAGPDKSG